MASAIAGGKLHECEMFEILLAGTPAPQIARIREFSQLQARDLHVLSCLYKAVAVAIAARYSAV